MFTTPHENGKMSFCRVTAAVGCRKLLSATDTQMTTSSEWIRVFIAWSRFMINFLLIFFFFLTTEKGLAGVGIFPSWPNPFGVLKTFQVRKWTLLPARIRYSKHKTKIAPWEAWRAASLRPQDGEPLRGKPGELLPPPPGRWTPQRALPCNELSPQALTRAGPSRFSFGTSLLWPLQSCCDYGKGSWVWSKWQRALSKPSVWRCFPHWRDQCCNLTLPISNRSLCVHFSFLGSLVNLMTQYANGHNNKNHSVDIRS